MFGNKTEPCSAKNDLCNLEKASQFCKKLIWKDVHSGNEISLTKSGLARMCNASIECKE